jgi:hypothetical protein
MRDQSRLFLVEWIIATILVIIPVWRILRKAGFSPALSLFTVVPLLGPVGLLALLAFGEWPALARRAREDIASTFE